jgi:type II secretory pathway pseudopilin PulG
MGMMGRSSLLARTWRCDRTRRRAAAFALVELMIVVAIISLLAMLAIPAIQRVQRRAKIAAIVNDFRVFSAAFETYAQEGGKWPADTAAGAMPPTMAGRLNAGAWTRTTPIGGKYNWEFNQQHFGTRYMAAISISGTAGAPLPLDVNALLDLEKAIDGGDMNLLGGRFHVGTGLVPLFIIQP